MRDITRAGLAAPSAAFGLTLRRRCLPIPLSPIESETLRSYLRRLTDTNLLKPQHLFSLSRQPKFLDTLRDRTGLTERQLVSALPEVRSSATLERWPHLIGRPSAKAGTRPACTHCIVRRLGREGCTITVFASHEQLVCHTHRRWLGSAELKCPAPNQFSVARCPDIAVANRKHRVLIQKWGREFVRASFADAVACMSTWARWSVVTQATDISHRWAQLGVREDLTPLEPPEIAAWYPNAVAITEIILAQNHRYSTAGSMSQDIINDGIARLQGVIAGLLPSGAWDPFRRAIVTDYREISGQEVE